MNILKKLFFEIYGAAKFKDVDRLENIEIDNIPVYNPNNKLEAITRLSIYCPSITFNLLDEKLSNFDRDTLIDEIISDIQLKENKGEFDGSKLKNILKSIYYCTNINDSCVCNMDKNIILLLPINDKTEMDILNRLKLFLKKWFGITIQTDRNIHLFTRDGFKKIVNSYNDQDISTLLNRTSLQSLEKNEDLKDFLAKPIKVNNKTVGGYAKMCPLCNVKIHTELTGWRIVPLTQISNEKAIKFKLICCPNCHDIFSYASNYWIDIKKWQSDSVLSLRVDINGYLWEPKEFKVKLAHKVLIDLLNRD